MKIFVLFFSVAIVCFCNHSHGVEATISEPEPKERLEVINEKIEERKRKSLEEERAIEKAQDELKKYTQSLKNIKSPEQKKLFEEKITLTKKTLDTALENKSKEDAELKTLISEKENVQTLQNSLMKEASSTEGQESLISEEYQRCIKEKIDEHYGLKKEQTSSEKKLVDQLATAIKKLISYEWVTFANSDAITQSAWEKIREKARTSKPTDKNYDATYKKLLETVSELQTSLEKLTQKKSKESPSALVIDCSAGYFASEAIAKKILKTVDETSGYDL